MKIVNVEVKKNEDKIFPFVWTNNKLNEFTVRVELVGDHASLTILGIFFGTSTNSVTFNTDVTHKGIHTKSLTLIRAVCMDSAVFSNDGMVRIVKGAKDTNGYFDSKVLLFNNARGRSVPSLEIDENEVKAGHGSTIGRPDENQLFYLRSRGLTEREAEKLMIAGFFNPVIEMLPKKEKVTIKNTINDQINNVQK